MLQATVVFPSDGAALDTRIVRYGLSGFMNIRFVRTVRAAGRSTQGVKLLNLEEEDQVAAAVVIPPEEAKTEPENGTLLQ